MALFSKKNKEREIKSKEAKKDLENVEKGEIAREDLEAGASGLSDEALAKAGINTHKILRGFYISEKASMGNSFDQYVFRVFDKANKSEVKKEVSKMFNVKVKSVKMVKLPEKRRDFGRHPGTKPGFKKAIVVLEKGHTIGQAKP